MSHETPRGAQDNTGELGKYPLCPAVCLGKGWAEVLQAKLGMSGHCASLSLREMEIIIVPFSALVVTELRY